MSHKAQKISALIQGLSGRALDAHYLGYFECFNQQLFFEAHEVLEQLWLPQRGQPKDFFYKALIQLAGAFVHIQKKRLLPARALFTLATENLSKYPSPYESLDLVRVQKLISTWMAALETAAAPNELPANIGWPKLALEK